MTKQALREKTIKQNYTLDGYHCRPLWPHFYLITTLTFDLLTSSCQKMHNHQYRPKSIQRTHFWKIAYTVTLTFELTTFET